MTVKDITDYADKIGSCGKLKDVRDWKTLTRTLFSAQGREFCQEHNFPTLEHWQQMECDTTEYGIYVDNGNLSLTATRNVAIVGNTSAKVIISGNDRVYKVMVMHGAKVTIKASDYAVILPINISGEIKIEKDDTVVVL